MPRGRQVGGQISAREHGAGGFGRRFRRRDVEGRRASAKVKWHISGASPDWAATGPHSSLVQHSAEGSFISRCCCQRLEYFVFGFDTTAPPSPTRSPWCHGLRGAAMMKPTTSLLALRSRACAAAPPSLRPAFLTRSYATQQGLGTTATGPRRRSVTPFNDDGYVPWSELSAAEKTARATQQSFNFGMIIVGVVLTV